MTRTTIGLGGRLFAPAGHLLVLILAAAPLAGCLAADWLPVPPEDLAMTAEPKAPGAPAILLYREVQRDDALGVEVVYERIKILKESGLARANIKLEYTSGESISGIEARTIQPDGQVVAFDGKVYEQRAVDSGNLRLMTKSFTLPAAAVGSIIEYRYRHNLLPYYVFNSRWLLSTDLFIRLERLSLNPSRGFTLRYAWPMGLPDGAVGVPTTERGRIHLEVHDVQPFIAEEEMPPEHAMQQRVDFIYRASGSDAKEPVRFWDDYGRERWKDFDHFIDHRGAMEAAVREIVDPGDGEEERARKIYARVQMLRNLSFHRPASGGAAAREDLHSIDGAADAWKYGYGYARDLNWLFIALVRAAGLQADSVLVSTRDTYLFNIRMLNPNELNDDVVVLTIGGRELYVDPATPLTPFGLLPWQETGVHGLRLAKKGSSWVTVPTPGAGASRIERAAHLALDAGTLTGTVTVTYTGIEAQLRRTNYMDEDDVARKTFLEDELRATIPVGSQARLTNTPQWGAPGVPLVAEFDVEIPGYATQAGRRMLLPVGIFGADAKHAFEHPTRNFPVYIRYPHESRDSVSIRIPAQWQVSSLPTAIADDHVSYAFTSRAAFQDGALTLSRTLGFATLIVPTSAYDAYRDFYQKVRTTDDEPVVLVPATAPKPR